MDNHSKTIIYAKTTFSAVHTWANPNKDVRFAWWLEFPHQHNFLVTVWIEVEHNDREIEFFELKNEIDKFCSTCLTTDHDHCLLYSCEQMAIHICEHIKLKYQDKTNNFNRYIKVEVAEDSNFGAIVDTNNILLKGSK